MSIKEELLKCRLPDDEIPYGTNVHLDALVYDGLYRKKFIEGAESQLSSPKLLETVDRLIEEAKKEERKEGIEEVVEWMEREYSRHKEQEFGIAFGRVLCHYFQQRTLALISQQALNQARRNEGDTTTAPVAGVTPK